MNCKRGSSRSIAVCSTKFDTMATTRHRQVKLSALRHALSCSGLNVYRFGCKACLSDIIAPCDGVVTFRQYIEGRHGDVRAPRHHQSCPHVKCASACMIARAKNRLSINAKRFSMPPRFRGCRVRLRESFYDFGRYVSSASKMINIAFFRRASFRARSGSTRY